MAIFLLTGASGSGKTTLAHEIQKVRLWEECISHTTRPKREGEISGMTYYFTKEETFTEMVENNEFAEWVKYDGNLYGISKREIGRVKKLHQHIFIIVDYNGYQQVKEQYPDAVGIFIHMTKEECLANMLLRGDSIDKALKRIETYDDEMKNRNNYDYVVKNVRNRQNYTENILKAIIHQNSQK